MVGGIEEGEVTKDVMVINKGMKDMKTSFDLANPTLTELNWSFIPKISGETVGEGDGAVVGGSKEGEVTKVAQVTEDVVVINEEIRDDPTLPKQATLGDH